MNCARRKTMKGFPLSSPLPRVSSAWERVRVRELKQVRICEGEGAGERFIVLHTHATSKNAPTSHAWTLTLTLSHAERMRGRGIIFIRFR